MEGNSRSDSYRMITYSVPLIYEGTVYGVMGVEISTKYMACLLYTSSRAEVKRTEKTGALPGGITRVKGSGFLLHSACPVYDILHGPV